MTVKYSNTIINKNVWLKDADRNSIIFPWSAYAYFLAVRKNYWQDDCIFFMWTMEMLFGDI